MLWWTLRQLKSKNREKRKNAAERLGASGAAEALVKIGGARAVEPLVAVLKDKDNGVRKAVAEALVKIGWQPVNDIQRALHATALRKWEELVSLGAASVEPLVAALKDEDSDVRREAAEALGKIGDARAALQKWEELVSLGAASVEPLVAVLHNPELSQTAVYTLEQILEKSAQLIPHNDLQAVLAINNVVRIEYQSDSCSNTWRTKGPVDCSRLWQLARQELIRRGLKA